MKKIADFFKWLGNDIKDIGITFAKGDWKTRISFLIMGFGSLLRGAWLRGVAFLGIQLAYIWYMVKAGAGYLSKFGKFVLHVEQ